MANTVEAHDILSDTSDDDTRAEGATDAEWVRAEDILYQRIVVTRANVVDKYDEKYDRNRTFAYINFYFYDDETATPRVFRTGWQKIRKQINALNALRAVDADPYPVECGLAEILIPNPLVGDDGTARFPLHLLPFADLDEAETAATSYSLKSTPSNTPPATAAPAPQPGENSARPASSGSARSTARTAGNGSAPRKLAGRGN